MVPTSKDWFETLINVKGLEQWPMYFFYSCVFNPDMLNKMLEPETNIEKNVESISVHSLVEERDKQVDDYNK